MATLVTVAGLSGQGVLAGVDVLVVEDNDDAREMFTVLFELSGATVAAAASGNAGWQAFQRDPPDLVISDLSMPNGDGYELVQRIRALPADEGGLTPAIAMSATDGPEASLAAGFHAHVVKPTSTLSLVDIVRSFVRDGAETRSTWTLTTSPPNLATLTFTGHPTAHDMRAATTTLAKTLEASMCHVVVDLRRISGFDLSVGSVAERTVWHVRRNITGATIVGGSFLARLVANAACVVLGISCTFAESWPA